MAEQPLTATAPTPSSQNATASAPSRPPITCHVLDTTTGRPAANIPVTLTLISPLGPSAPLSAITNSDGRVASWGGTPPLEDLFGSLAQGGAAGGTAPEMVWALKFDAGSYFKGDCFWTEIEIRFRTVVGQGTGEKKDHWHVPLLLGPWTYTTYRGS